MAKLNRSIALLLTALLMQSANGAWIETGYAVDSRVGVKQMFVVSVDKSVTERDAVKHMVVLLTGGNGAIGQAIDGVKEQKPDRVALRGFMAERLGVVVAVGLPSDQSQGLSLQWRESEQHVQDVGAVMDVLMKQYPAARVTLLGFSNGTRSATHIGAVLGKKWGARLQGVVLLSPSMEAFRDDWMAALGGSASQTKVPVLVVHHKRDSCLLFDNVESQARSVDFITVDDTKQPRPKVGRRDCGNSSAHQFGGKEAKVYQSVVDWITAGKLANLNDDN